MLPSTVYEELQTNVASLPAPCEDTDKKPFGTNGGFPHWTNSMKNQ